MKMTVNIPQQDADRLKEMARRQQVTSTYVLRQAIGTAWFFAENPTARILVQRPGEQEMEIILR